MTAVAIGLGVLGTITVSSGYPRVLIALVILGLGMGTAMVPATESIMGSLPLAKAGLGSAMNDTTRQIGGALGVAILGSVFASSYTANISSAVSGLPAEAADAASRSVGAALEIGAQMGGATGAAIITAAKESFISAMDRGLFVGATIALVGAMVALIWLPSRAATPPEEPLPEELVEQQIAVAVDAAK
jgi:xanthosine utilization system XapX-like protein